jgi:hypothetical protein
MILDDIIPHLFRIACATLPAPVPQVQVDCLPQTTTWRRYLKQVQVSNSLIYHEIAQLLRPQVLVIDIPKNIRASEYPARKDIYKY